MKPSSLPQFSPFPYPRTPYPDHTAHVPFQPKSKLFPSTGAGEKEKLRSQLSLRKVQKLGGNFAGRKAELEAEFASSFSKCPFLAVLLSQPVTPWPWTLTRCSYFGSPGRNVPVWSRQNSPVSSVNTPLHSPAKEIAARALSPPPRDFSPAFCPGPFPTPLYSPQQRRAVTMKNMVTP